jgi:DNA-binding transcriptional regulator GbsR (MarR family)
MDRDGQQQAAEARRHLTEIGARISQELGGGRIVGQVLVHLYLQPEAQSLDSIGAALALSKASISIAVRQLERLGFVRQVWVTGDRKKYYRSADNIGSSIQQGLLSFLQQKVDLFGTELDSALCLLDDKQAANEDMNFLRQRISRAKKLQNILFKVLTSPLPALLAKISR